MKFWNRYSNWEAAEEAWENGVRNASQTTPIKKLKVLPQMPGITEETGHHLKWKSFKYMFSHDVGRKIRRHIWKHPLRYSVSYVKALLKKKGYKREGDFFLYGIPSVEEFEKQACQPSTLLVVGFSYCQKPHECPSGRFNDLCVRDPQHGVCRQCDIGKVLHALPDKAIPLIIPTVHYIGDQIFQLLHAYPKKQLLFLITACELTLEMFGDWGHMAQIRGIGVRLDGRICNTFRAFELSEVGIKPGLTVVQEETQRRVLDLIRRIRSDVSV